MKIYISTKDDLKLEYPNSCIEQSPHIKTFTEINQDEVEIPAKDFSSKSIKKLLEWVNYHEKNKAPEFDKPLIKRIEEYKIDKFHETLSSELESDVPLLVELVMASNALNVPTLLEFTSAKIASLAKGKTTNQIRTLFGIENDFSKEEEEKMNEELSWIEEAEGL